MYGTTYTNVHAHVCNAFRDYCVALWIDNLSCTVYVFFFFAGDIINVVGILFLNQVPVFADKLRVFVVILWEYFF